ncbi:Mitogen-activated protein kinase 12 [Merluccius polli]|uniref:Mitogen-activated protein kinase 12 n=1 Tax=Merluccius polli TaxID=89951 RepID=A0AA47MQJ7_MERPO|nr:Mitogen-activated protein kinase 12 [Merluccius polli]
MNPFLPPSDPRLWAGAAGGRGDDRLRGDALVPSPGVDIWSVGCIMAEMLLGKPLFKGNDHLDQLKEIMKVTGTPAADFVVKLQSQDAKNYIRNLPTIPKKDLHTIFSKASTNAVCVLERMLLLDPEARVGAADALAMPFFGEFRDPEEETEALPYDHSMDNTDLPVDQWKPSRVEREVM